MEANQGLLDDDQRPELELLTEDAATSSSPTNPHYPNRDDSGVKRTLPKGDITVDVEKLSADDVADSRQSDEDESSAPVYGPEELPPMPWFGMDIGGTLSKLVYFEPVETSDTEQETVKNIR